MLSKSKRLAVDAFANALLLAASLTAAAAQAQTSSPLVTADQQALDALSVQVNQLFKFPVLRSEARAAYVLAHGLPLSDEAQSRLDGAIDELAFSAIQKAVNNDPNYPKVYWVDAPPRQWGNLKVPGGRYSFDNPDNIYRTIPIDGGARYVLHGHRHGAGPADVTFSLISDPNAQQTVAFLAGSDLVVDGHGDYTVTIDSDPANGRVNHIQSTSAAKQLFVRNNLGDWNTETPDALSIERTGPTTSAARKGLLAISSDAWFNLQESVVTYGVGALGVKTYANAVNTLPAPTSSATLGTLVSQASSFGHFKLADDEVWVVTARTGGARYLVFPVTDPWSITVDPIHHQSSLNNRQALSNTDGSFTFVVGPHDPGVYNWIDTAGLHEGTVMVRWQGLPASTQDGGATISARVVKLTALSSALPTETRYVTATEREAQIQARVAGYARRTAP